MFRQEVLRDYFLRFSQVSHAIDGGLLSDGFVRFQNALGQHHLDRQHFAGVSILIRPV